MGKQKTFGRSRPSVAYELYIRRELEKLGQEMEADVKARLFEYVESGGLAQDAAPVRWRTILQALRREWYAKYRARGMSLARWLALKADKRTAAQIQRKLKAFGFSFAFDPAYTAVQKEVIKNVTAEGVGLIRSIPQEYLRRVQVATAAAFKRGGDNLALKRVLQTILDRIGNESRTKAALIARDQNQKATQAFATANAMALGARRGRWIHVPGRYSSRITHKAMDGKTFDLATGLFDSDVGRNVKPGELYYCNCQFEALMPGFDN